ncbi:uncharacterized protein LOC135134177 [Zophobas morio]|uniref:uncharacterized protein LOC135134177 n=1 Tax=Zophobas morio TaxID=2755281 RepID=UPI0030835FB2
MADILKEEHEKSHKPVFKVHISSAESSADENYDVPISYHTVASIKEKWEKSSQNSQEEDIVSIQHESYEPSRKARFSETLEQHLLKDISQYLLGNTEPEDEEHEGSEETSQKKGSDTKRLPLLLSQADKEVGMTQVPVTPQTDDTARRSEIKFNLSEKSDETGSAYSKDGTPLQEGIDEEHFFVRIPDMREIAKPKAHTVEKHQHAKKFKEVKTKMGTQPVPSNCERFLSIKNYTKLLVDRLTTQALSQSQILQRELSRQVSEGIEYFLETENSAFVESFDTPMRVLKWPIIDQFTVESGITKIKEYLSTWHFNENWKHCVNYLYQEADAACSFFRYEVIFGIPCKEYPIPQATASVYFTFEVSRIKPRNCNVDVYYSFEGQRLKCTPGKFTCQEKWLFYIIDAKLTFFKNLTF